MIYNFKKKMAKIKRDNVIYKYPFPSDFNEEFETFDSISSLLFSMNRNRHQFDLSQNISDVFSLDIMKFLLRKYSMEVITNEIENCNFKSIKKMNKKIKLFLTSGEENSLSYRYSIIKMLLDKKEIECADEDKVINECIECLSDEEVVEFAIKMIIESDVNSIDEITYNYLFDFYRDVEDDILNIMFNLMRFHSWNFDELIRLLRYVGDYEGFEYMNENYRKYLRIKKQINRINTSENIVCLLILEESFIYKKYEFYKIEIDICRSEINEVEYEFYGILEEDIFLRVPLDSLNIQKNIHCDDLFGFISILPIITDFYFEIPKKI